MSLYTNALTGLMMSIHWNIKRVIISALVSWSHKREWVSVSTASKSVRVKTVGRLVGLSMYSLSLRHGGRQLPSSGKCNQNIYEWMKMYILQFLKNFQGRWQQKKQINYNYWGAYSKEYCHGKFWPYLFHCKEYGKCF